MSELQFWSIIVTFIGTLGIQQIIMHLLGRGKIKTDEATAIRAELRAERDKLKDENRALEVRIDDLEKVVHAFRALRIDMYRVLQENNVSKNVLEQLRFLEIN